MYDHPASTYLTLAGAFLGIIAAAFLGWLRYSRSAIELQTSLLPDLAFGFLYAAPFLLALAAFFLKDGIVRSAIWIGCGAAGVIAGMTAMSGVSLIMLPGAICLILGGVEGFDTGEKRWTSGAIALTLSIAIVSIAAFGMYFRSYETVCWQVTVQSGQRVVERVPSSSNQELSSSGSGGGCSTAYVSSASAGSTIAVWAVAGPIILLAGMLMDRREDQQSSRLVANLR
jgi:hypothetical protein